TEDDFPFADIICTKTAGSYKHTLKINYNLFDTEGCLVDVRERKSLEQYISLQNELVSHNGDDLPF
ncbi:MAG: hypothetical protein K2I27_03225, partial [Bacteroides sp.]|nr:hypothetical protein [Bacteroides sp.]